MQVRKQKLPKVKNFVNEKLSEGIFSPSEMSRLYNEKYGLEGKKDGNGKSLERSVDAFEKAIRRMGISREQRLEMKHENGKAKDTKDIEEYDEVKRYLLNCDEHNVTLKQRNRTLKDLRRLWEWVNRTNPRTWTYEELIECMKTNIGKDESGRWKKPNAIRVILGAFNRCFKGILPEGFSMGMQSEGEHKDFWEFEESNRFIANQESTKEMSRLGWQCLFVKQENNGCREGIDCKTGILSSTWESINYETRRCEIHDKGEKGHSRRLWVQVPCDLFQWLNGWNLILEYHKEVFGYYPTNLNHGSGRMFPIRYDQYLKQFHAITQKSNIIGKRKNTPHILRMTHAQYCKRIGITLENICGDTTTKPNIGYYGVGWTDLKILLKFYLTKEPYEYAEQDEKIAKRLFEMKQSFALTHVENSKCHVNEWVFVKGLG
jgi:hypothetical protein